MPDLEALIRKLEMAMEGSREFDRHIVVVINAGAKVARIDDEMLGVIDTNNEWLPIPHFTTSLDSALSLVPEGWAYRIQRNLSGLCFVGLQGPEMEKLVHAGGYKSAPLAICIAALRARAAR